jgi:flagellar biosynthesis protein FlgN
MQPTELLQQLADDITTAGSLLALIDLEFQALSTRDLEQLGEILAQKQPLVAQLSQHGTERSNILTKCGLPSTRESLARLSRSPAEQAQLAALATTLEDSLERCRQSNERNGRFINTHQVALDNMLCVLRGTPKTPTLYDRTGSTEKTGRQRSLSQA